MPEVIDIPDFPDDVVDIPDESSGLHGRALYGQAAGSVLKGAGKGILSTITGLGEMAHGIGEAIGLAEPTEAFDWAREELAPVDPFEKAGFTAEQIAEFAALPMGKGKALAQAAKGALGSGGLALAQGSSPQEAALAAGLGAIPLGSAVGATGEKLGELAPKIVRSGLKPTVASAKKVAGVSRTGINQPAEDLSEFVLRERLTSPEQARALIQEAEQATQAALQQAGGTTDAPMRAIRYLEDRAIRAENAGLLNEARTYREAIDEVFASQLGMDLPGGIRTLRTDVSPAEALAMARERKALAGTGGQWGAMKPAGTEANKQIERGLRDAVKSSVPEARPLLAREGMGLRAAEALDRAAFRMANRDPFSLPAYVLLGGAISSMNPAAIGAGTAGVTLAAAANWLRNNPLKAGIYFDDLARAIEAGDAATATQILQQLGVGAAVSGP